MTVSIARKICATYVVTDFISVNIAWFIFLLLRYSTIPFPAESFQAWYHYPMVWGGQICIPLMMLFIYWMSGYYNDVLLRSRVSEAISTLCCAATGAIIIFFVSLIDDFVNRSIAYEQVFILIILLFVIVYIPRGIITSRTICLIRKKRLQFPWIVVGAGQKAIQLVKRIEHQSRTRGQKFIGFVPVPGEIIHPQALPLVNFSDIDTVCRSNKAHDILFQPDTFDTERQQILQSLYTLGHNIYVSPDFIPLSGTAHYIDDIVGEPLVNINRPPISSLYLNIKRITDIVCSLIAMIMLSPVLLILAACVSLTSRGGALYRQERLGLHGKPFTIIKFRTMVHDAELHSGPMLSSANDPRITRMGHFMRKYRLDELPQLWNVLRGDMSIVGPRPERSHFTQLIIQRAPSYARLTNVRPGITSWGMVKYGYASTVEQMIERMRYDLLYVENASLMIDIKILIYTIRTILTGRGL